MATGAAPPSNGQSPGLGDAQGTRWTKTTLDGFGRTISVVKGHDNVTISEVDTQYAPCACSPLGKMSRASQPYVPGAMPVWTAYTYDGAHHVLSRTDEKGQGTGYSYDAYGRLTAAAHYPQGFANPADPGQQVNYYYDTNPYGDPIANSTWGRLAAVAFGNACGSSGQGTSICTDTTRRGG